MSTRQQLSFLTIAFAALIGPCAAAEQVMIGGTGNALGSMQLIADAFRKQNPDVQITVLPSLGSAGAIKAVLKRALDVALSARPLEDDERNLVNCFEYARTPLVFAVPLKSKVTAITLEQAADIYADKTLAWPDGTRIRLVLRPAADSDAVQVKKMSPRLDAALSDAEKRPGMPYAVTDQENADKIATIPGAFGVTSLALINTENRPLQALRLDGVEPTPQNGIAGTYPHFKRLYLIAQPKPAPAVQRFIAFLQSPVGKEILMRAGNWVP